MARGATNLIGQANVPCQCGRMSLSLVAISPIPYAGNGTDNVSWPSEIYGSPCSSQNRQ